MPRLSSRPDSRSLFSIDTVPTSTGRPGGCISLILSRGIELGLLRFSGSCIVDLVVVLAANVAGDDVAVLQLRSWSSG